MQQLNKQWPHRFQFLEAQMTSDERNDQSSSEARMENQLENAFLFFFFFFLCTKRRVTFK